MVKFDENNLLGLFFKNSVKTIPKIADIFFLKKKLYFQPELKKPLSSPVFYSPRVTQEYYILYQKVPEARFLEGFQIDFYFINVFNHIRHLFNFFALSKSMDFNPLFYVLFFVPCLESNYI